MSRLEQVFAAPGPEDEPISPEESPWLDGRWVTVPYGDWSAILRFAEDLDDAGGQRLWLQSGTSAAAGTAAIPFDAGAIRDSVDFLQRVAGALIAADPLVPEPTDEQPEAYPNEELARMAEHVRAVMEEALRRGEPFRAWNE